MNNVTTSGQSAMKYLLGVAAVLSLSFTSVAMGESFRVQCPLYTNIHPDPTAASTLAAIAAAGADATYQSVFPGAVKCQEVGGTDGFATMGDGNQIYLFGFAPLSGLADIASGKSGTQTPDVFNNQDDATGNGAKSEPAAIMNTGILFANSPAPLMTIDEDDEFYLTLSNVGQIMRPDLFEQHTVHFHGYPNASSFFDGVPDASVAINIAGSFTYYYTAPDAGTYFWHCHIAPPEHLQMGMVGQLYVRPRQNKVPDGANLYDALKAANVANGKRVTDLDALSGTPSGRCSDILCTGATPLPTTTTATKQAGAKYAYNDGDGSTRYDVDVPIQMMGFDPNFHFVGMTFNPEAFIDMKDKYFMLNGRSYPDTVNTNVNNGEATGADGHPVANGPLATQSADGASRPSQPLHTLITIDKSNGQTRALLRISDLSVTEFTTLATLGVPMKVIAHNARLLRDMAGNNMYYDTNSITLGGGESIDVILDVSDQKYTPGQKFYLYSTNLDHLSNDAENFGGMMTEIQVL
jgi:FtsP/CotA-like multicopper oxidase with cupredoxin domain